MDDLALEHCRLLDATDVAELCGLPKARERHKWGCPACGSSDALHVYSGPGRGSTCFSCNAHPDAIDLVELTQGLDFQESIKWLAGEFGFDDLIDGGADPHEARRRTREIKDRIEERRQEKARLEVESRKKAWAVYDKLWPMLELGPSGADCLESRAIPTKVARHVGIRSVESDDQWQVIRRKFWPGTLESAGLTGRKDGDTYPVPWRAPFLVIPYWLEGGGVDVLRFRDLSGDAPKYLSPLGQKPTTPYLGHAAHELADDYQTLYICEGEINALSVVWAGSPAISSCGNGVWRGEWSKPFRWWRRVVVLCDGDDAGRAFAERVRDATADAVGRDWTDKHLKRRIFIPGTDANDALVDGRLKELVRAA